MPDGRMARADMATGLVLFVLSVALIYGAWTMDRLELRQIHPLSVPGLLPGLLGLALAVCSVLLIAQSLRPGGRQPAAMEADAPANPGAFRRLGVAVVLCLVYALGLVGWAPFWLATAIFVTAFILVFEWAESASAPEKLRSLAWALAIGMATGWSVAYAFSELFLVRLP